MSRLLGRLDAAVARWLRVGIIAAVVLIQALLTFNILARFVPVITTVWTEEVIEFLFAWVVFLGAALLYREGVLFRVELAESALPPALRRPLWVVIQACMLVFAVVFAVEGWQFTRETFVESPFLHLSKVAWHASLPAAGMLLVAYAVAGLWRALSGGPLPGAAAPGEGGEHVI